MTRLLHILDIEDFTEEHAICDVNAESVLTLVLTQHYIFELNHSDTFILLSICYDDLCI